VRVIEGRIGSRKRHSPAWAPRGAQTYDHRHRFRRAGELVPYDFRGADELICDFFAAVEQACRQEGAPFEFEAEDVEVEMEDDDNTDLPD
jgi:hypothetical protein